MHPDDVSQLLQAQLPDATIVVKNPLGDGMHFHALLIDQGFEGMPLLARHRLVMGPLREHLRKDMVHALSIKTYAPSELHRHEATLIKFGLDPASFASQ